MKLNPFYKMRQNHIKPEIKHYRCIINKRQKDKYVYKLNTSSGTSVIVQNRLSNVCDVNHGKVTEKENPPV